MFAVGAGLVVRPELKTSFWNCSQAGVLPPPSLPARAAKGRKRLKSRSRLIKRGVFILNIFLYGIFLTSF
jgi:hypothetical protein